jgi:Phage Tail Collar Domain
MSTTPIYALPYPVESDSADVPRDIQALAQRLEAVLPSVGIPTGAGIDWYSAWGPPAGFLLCDGSAVSRVTYAALFAVIGVTWGGGDGINTFNLPDTRGRVSAGVASGGHPDVNALGANDGTTVGARKVRHGHTSYLTAGHNLTLPNHAHDYHDPGHLHAMWRGTNGLTPGGFTWPGTGTDVNNKGDVVTDYAVTGAWVGDPSSFPAINGQVTIGGGIGANIAGGTTDGPSYVVVAKAIKT